MHEGENSCLVAKESDLKSASKVSVIQSDSATVCILTGNGHSRSHEAGYPYTRKRPHLSLDVLCSSSNPRSVSFLLIEAHKMDDKDGSVSAPAKKPKVCTMLIFILLRATPKFWPFTNHLSVSNSGRNTLPKLLYVGGGGQMRAVGTILK